MLKGEPLQCYDLLCPKQEIKLLVQHAARRVEEHSPSHIIQLLWSAAKAAHWSPALEKLAASQWLIKELPAQQPPALCQLLWALARLDLRPRNVLDRTEAAMSTKGEA